jgi:hypothetical protein
MTVGHVALFKPILGAETTRILSASADRADATLSRTAAAVCSAHRAAESNPAANGLAGLLLVALDRSAPLRHERDGPILGGVGPRRG